MKLLQKKFGGAVGGGQGQAGLGAGMLNCGAFAPQPGAAPPGPPVAGAASPATAPAHSPPLPTAVAPTAAPPPAAAPGTVQSSDPAVAAAVAQNKELARMLNVAIANLDREAQLLADKSQKEKKVVHEVLALEAAEGNLRRSLQESAAQGDEVDSGDM